MDSYSGRITDAYKGLVDNANIFDISLEQETFNDLSLEKLKLRKSTHSVSPPHGGGYFENLRPASAGPQQKILRGSTMESRFRLSSISETEELVKLKNDVLSEGACSSKFPPSSFAEKTT